MNERLFSYLKGNMHNLMNLIRFLIDPIGTLVYISNFYELDEKLKNLLEKYRGEKK